LLDDKRGKEREGEGTTVDEYFNEDYRMQHEQTSSSMDYIGRTSEEEIQEEENATSPTTTTTTMMMSNNNISMNNINNNKRRYNITIGFYSALFFALTYLLASQLYNHPLFPIQKDSLEWNSTWLITTVVDYYGVCFCFGGIVLSSESSWWKGIAWNLGFCLAGSPICCLWVLVWTYRGRTLKING